MENEGGYSNHTADHGGETFMGITQRFSPDWAGWVLVDEMRESPLFPNCLEDNPSILCSVKEFYWAIWDRTGCSYFESQRMADVLFDGAVHLGKLTAVKYFQTAANVLNRGNLWPELLVDGRFGPKTREVMQLMSWQDEELAACVVIWLRGARYVSILVNDPSQEVFARGWFNRLAGQ